MIAHFLVAGSETTYWIEKVRLSKKPLTAGRLAPMSIAPGPLRSDVDW